MKLTAHIQLLPTTAQADALTRTLEAANAACTFVSRVAWTTKTFRKYDLQQAIYTQVREQFGLSAQLAIRVIAKVGDAYKLDKRTERMFKPLGSVAFDDRILSYTIRAKQVSIWTLDGRLKIGFAAGERQMQMLETRQGESDLVFHRGTWYLLVTCEIPEPDPVAIDGVLGVDLGIINLATDSDGDVHSGAAVERKRQWYTRRRQALQKVGTKSAKRRLKTLAGKQRRFQKDVNHGISKHLVAKAERTKRAVALEDLSGIRTRARVKGPEQRARHSNWAFGQLRFFTTYKLQRVGIPLFLRNPAYTSQRCTMCGGIDKRNRRTQALFCCVSCGHTSPADWNAACNIRDYDDWAAVIQLMVSNATG